MKVTVQRPQPEPPPIETVTIVFTRREAELLWKLAGGIGGVPNYGYVVSDRLAAEKDLRSVLTSPLWSKLEKYFP